MKVFVGCEYSGIVRDSFIKAGHQAVSCDTLESESNKGHHIKEDIFLTLSLVPDNFYDLIIAHPPCTYLCVAGNRYYSDTKYRRISIKWTELLWELCKRKAKSVCFENPVGVLSTRSTLGKPSQYIQPWQFGHTETKKTGIWLYNLPLLEETNNVKTEMDLLPAKEKHKIWYASPGKDRQKIRSKTYKGIAKAMANQWGLL